MHRLSPVPGWRRSRLVNSGLPFFRLGDTSLAAFRVCLFRFVAVPVCCFSGLLFFHVPVRRRSGFPCSGLIASLGTPSFLTRFRPHHTPTSPPYSAQSGPVRHHSVTFRAAHHSADSTPLPLFSSPIILPDALTLRRPNLPCNLPHTFRQHPGLRILPHSTPFSLTKTGDTEQSLPWSIWQKKSAPIEAFPGNQPFTTRSLFPQ